MTPERWQRINEMFHSALVLDGRERSAFLVTQSAGDDALRAKVAALLASHEQAEGFIQGSVFNDAAQLLVEDEAEAMIGQHIGLYEITREIGRGGMGSVYLSTRDDDQFKQQVVIQIVRRGMDPHLLLPLSQRAVLAASIIKHRCLFDGGSTKWFAPTSSWNTSRAIDDITMSPALNRRSPRTIPHGVLGGSVRAPKSRGSSRYQTQQYPGDRCGRAEAARLWDCQTASLRSESGSRYYSSRATIDDSGICQPRAGAGRARHHR
jgi:hypothetical protein